MRAHQALSIQPLPGGIDHYDQTLSNLILLCDSAATVEVFLELMMQEYPTVRTVAVAKGYLYNVLCVLDFAQVVNGRIESTPEGRSYARDQDQLLLERQLRTHVAGVEELIDELRISPRPIGQLLPAMQGRGYSWSSDWQVRFRLRWLRVAGLVERRTHKESRSRYPEWALTREPTALP